MSKWIIRDWMGSGCNLLGRTEFDSFGDARAEIDRFADDEVERTTDGMTDEDKESIYNGICADLYAVNVDENGKELPNTGQYTM